MQADGNADPTRKRLPFLERYTMTLPNLTSLKTQAKRLRAAVSDRGGARLSHSQALELVADQYGFRDWNTLSAAARQNGFRSFAVGDRVKGHYLGQPFEGEVLGYAKTGTPDVYRVTVQFDQPVDVVTFDSFSSYRSRVTCTIRESGVALNRTSNGQPYLVLEAAA